MENTTTNRGSWTQFMGEFWGTHPEGLTPEEGEQFVAAYERHVNEILARYGITMLGNGEFVGPLDAPGLPEDEWERDDLKFELSDFDFDWGTL